MSETRDRSVHIVEFDTIWEPSQIDVDVDVDVDSDVDVDVDSDVDVDVDSDGSNASGVIDFNHNHSNAETSEKELTLFALRLAILEQLASGIGTLAFIWATVVLLGGFAVVLSRRDFRFITITLVIEGARIYSRSSEIEWQNQSLTFANGPQHNFGVLRRIIAFFNPTSAVQADRPVEGWKTREAPARPDSSRTWKFDELPLITFCGHVFFIKNIGGVFIWLQVSFAIGSMALSLLQLVSQNFGELVSSEIKNRNTALNLFYSLAFANSVLFLMEKLYWFLKIYHTNLLERVSRRCMLYSYPSRMNTDFIKQFFYHVYSASIKDSIFGCLKKDLVSYAQKLLESEEPDENLLGAQILVLFVNQPQFVLDTMRKVATGKTMERLVEILSWNNKADNPIRMLAANIVAKISEKRNDSIRIAKIPGSLEAIASLLHTGNHDIESGYNCLEFNLLGLIILKYLARDDQICVKIGMLPGLISKIIEFTSTSANVLRSDPMDLNINLVRRALRVLFLLASSKGDIGNALRQQIARNVFIVGYLWDILKHREAPMVLRRISIQILRCLAMDDEATERIADTGGVINFLLELFLETGVSEEMVEAGLALSMLTMRSQKSCNMILQEGNVLVKLAEVVTYDKPRPYASRILHNVCVYAEQQHDGCLDAAIKKVFPVVLDRTMKENKKTLEESIGLLVAVCQLINVPVLFNEELAKANISLTIFVTRLIDILEMYKHPDIEFPRLRRFVIELSIWMMKASQDHLNLLKDSGMKKMLKSVAETTREIENFHLFSGSVGLGQQKATIADLLKEALKLLHSCMHQGSSSAVRDNN